MDQRSTLICSTSAILDIAIHHLIPILDITANSPIFANVGLCAFLEIRGDDKTTNIYDALPLLRHHTLSLLTTLIAALDATHSASLDTTFIVSLDTLSRSDFRASQRTSLSALRHFRHRRGHQNDAHQKQQNHDKCPAKWRTVRALRL